MPSIPNPKTQPLDYIRLIVCYLRTEGKNTEANELLDAITVLSSRQEALVDVLDAVVQNAERDGDTRLAIQKARAVLGANQSNHENFNHYSNFSRYS